MVTSLILLHVVDPKHWLMCSKVAIAGKKQHLSNLKKNYFF